MVELNIVQVGVGLVVFSFVQGMGYATANHVYDLFFKKKVEKHTNDLVLNHLKRIENKLKIS